MNECQRCGHNEDAKDCLVCDDCLDKERHDFEQEQLERQHYEETYYQEQQGREGNW